jgi:hypothetical protein
MERMLQRAIISLSARRYEGVQLLRLGPPFK